MLATAAGLWNEWERSEAIRADDYDSDIVEHLRRILARDGHDASDHLDEAMSAAGWSARDLLHALAPVVASFSGMQRALLRLLERVAASSGTGPDLRVQYEFVEGDVIDESLAAFRERVLRVEEVVAELRPLAFDRSHAFYGPLRGYRSDEAEEEILAISGAASSERWPFAAGLADADPTGHPRVDEVARRVIAVVRRVLARLDSVGENLAAVEAAQHASRADREEDGVLQQMINAATDYWPLSTAASVYRWTADVASGTTAASDDVLSEVEEWLDGFEAANTEEAVTERHVEELLDVLKMPTWRKRHEMYSAWIATQLDRAVDSRFEFVVTDGALRFPFHATLLARLPSATGPVELWCEVRSPASGDLSGDRKDGIQPDYRFQRPSLDAVAGRVTVAAVEVKQYLSPAASKHRGTMRDYVGNLPDAVVLLVAHGPLGRRIIDALPEPDRDRARVYPYVRVGRPRESAAFRVEIARLFPPPAPSTTARPTRIELHWHPPVRDLDLYVSGGDHVTSHRLRTTAHSTLRHDDVDGGPEIVDLDPSASGPLDIRVHAFSGDSVRAAAPTVTIYQDDAPILTLAPPEEIPLMDERWWDVARIDEDGRIIPSEQSRRIRPESDER